MACKAAAKGYFGKSLDQLTLAQDAILAAIPQSPTAYDLVRNAEEVCLDNVADGQECTNFKLVVPQDSEIVQRRNQVLDLMETRSPLTGNKHSTAEYEAAKHEPVVLVPQVVGRLEGAAVRVAGAARARPSCSAPTARPTARKVDTGGYKVITTLDYNMQKTAEKWVYAAARAPNAKDPSAILASRKIPASPPRSWILGLRGHNINNAAAGGHRLPDRRGPRLRRLGELHRPRATRSSSPSSTSWPTAGASPGRRSSRSTTRSASTTRR